MSGARRVGKVKVKKKCCRSTPRCKSCPVVVLLKARRKAEEKAARKAAKAAKAEKKIHKKKAGKKKADV
ncbi:hypothetical protein AB0425_20445 [Actinosynnema sp. NPDC051121]|nr:hypothetical protein [Saccharothrix sp.]